MVSKGWQLHASTRPAAPPATKWVTNVFGLGFLEICSGLEALMVEENRTEDKEENRNETKVQKGAFYF